ncbi:MAG: CCA tRNA nucleotidyltransferase [Endomicrobiales bacterium]|nr:CCA tRNA nucleotidyltransferase [Endomicrobiales bacterium]
MNTTTKEILKKIKKASDNIDIYVVGGWVRDALIKRKNRDLDIATSINPGPLARKISNVIKGRFVELDKKNKIYRVVLKGDRDLDYIDVAKLKGPDIYTDLKRRDFTINALAVSISNAIDEYTVIDPTGGIYDIKNKVVRSTNTGIFNEDPLRLLRAFRIACELKFNIEPKTKKLIKVKSKLIRKSANERVRDEIFKILSQPKSFVWIKEMDNAGLMDCIFPEIIKMKKSARNFYYHPQGLWQHAIETLTSLEEILDNLKKLFPGYEHKILNHLNQPLSNGITRMNLLKFVALMHDMAKPACAKKIGNKMRFLGHEKKGSEMIKVVLKGLRMSNKDIKIAQTLIGHHMRPINLGQSPVITDRAIFRLFRDIEDNLVDLMLLTLADCYSYRRIKVRKVVELKKQKKVVGKLITRYFDVKEKISHPKLLDGHVIMKKFNIKPSPLVGKLLGIVKEEQSLGKIKDVNDALTLIKRKLTRLKKRNIMN